MDVSALSTATLCLAAKLECFRCQIVLRISIAFDRDIAGTQMYQLGKASFRLANPASNVLRVCWRPPACDSDDVQIRPVVFMDV